MRNVGWPSQGIMNHRAQHESLGKLIALVVAEERRRAVAGTGVDAVSRARRRT